jgi:hypothetical protein
MQAPNKSRKVTLNLQKSITLMLIQENQLKQKYLNKYQKHIKPFLINRKNKNMIKIMVFIILHYLNIY